MAPRLHLYICLKKVEDVRNRIKELIEQEAGSNRKFAESIGISPAIISHILSGRNNPSLAVIQAITNVYTNVNSDYLINGKGSLYLDDEKNDTVKTGAESNRRVSALHDPAIRQVAPPEGVPLPKKEADNSRETAREESPPPESTNVYTNVNKAKRSIERVLIFYTDKTFEEYRP